ncbi:MAG: CotH kinase family protein [Candidatus Niameybacter stercoravium]|nr:CotH kinase family protein [Candidatus Niameybacter stercoravium]
MNSKWIVVGAVIGMLGISAWVSTWGEEQSTRVHQHLQEDGRQECTHDEAEFCTHLPIIAIDTQGQKIEIEKVEIEPYDYSKSSEITASIKVWDSLSASNHLTDNETFATLVRLRYRGNTSLNFDKKSYKLNFIHEDLSKNKDEDLLGMGKHDEWILNGPFLDKTLIRNYMCLNIAGEIMKDAPDVRFCEVFVDGVYQGVYVAMESIEKATERVDITSYKEGDPFTSYIIRSDRERQLPETLNHFTKYANKLGENIALEIIYPKVAARRPELKSFIEQDLSKFEKALYSFDYDDDKYGYKKFIEVESFIDYFIINEFFKNYDAGLYSTYFYKDIRGKLHIGPVWDFNNAADNFIDMPLDERGMDMVHRSWYFMLIKDEDFVEAIIKRYHTLREGWLNEELLLNYIDETIAFLGEAIERNNQVWGYSFDPKKVDGNNRLAPMERNVTSYEESILQLKDFIIRRGRWMDQHIEILRQYAHESKVKKFNH